MGCGQTYMCWDQTRYLTYDPIQHESMLTCTGNLHTGMLGYLFTVLEDNKQFSCTFAFKKISNISDIYHSKV